MRHWAVTVWGKEGRHIEGRQRGWRWRHFNSKNVVVEHKDPTKSRSTNEKTATISVHLPSRQRIHCRLTQTLHESFIGLWLGLWMAKIIQRESFSFDGEGDRCGFSATNVPACNFKHIIQASNAPLRGWRRRNLTGWLYVCVVVNDTAYSRCKKKDRSNVRSVPDDLLDATQSPSSSSCSSAVSNFGIHLSTAAFTFVFE